MPAIQCSLIAGGAATRGLPRAPPLRHPAAHLSAAAGASHARAARPLSGACLPQRRAAPRASRPRLAVAAAAASAPALTPGPTASSLWARFSALSTSLTNLFPIWVLGAALLALRQPAAFEFFAPSYVTPALAVTMLGMGMTLTFEDFRRVLATPRRIFAGFALQYTIMPALAFAVSRLMGLPLDYAIGLCIVGSCPGGTASNVVTFLAKADVPLSVAMTTASTMGAVVMTPLLTQLLLGTLVPVDAAGLLVSTLQVVLLPVLVGAALNSAFPRAMAALAPLSALSAVVLIALICGSVMAQNAVAVLEAGPRLLGAIFILHAGGFLAGYLLSKALKMPEAAARTNSIEVGMQNSALGAVLAATHFTGNPLAAVPCAISACMHSVLGSLLAAFWRSQTPGSSSGSSGAGAEEDSLEARQAAARAWIAAWRSGGPDAPGAAAAAAAAAAPVALAAEARSWIGAWRSRQPQPAAASPAAEARAWIQAWRATQQKAEDVGAAISGATQQLTMQQMASLIRSENF